MMLPEGAWQITPGQALHHRGRTMQLSLRDRCVNCAMFVVWSFAIAAGAGEPNAAVKVGIIGLDAHAVPWTRILHAPDVKPPLSDLRIVAAYPAFSADIPFSKDNIETNTAAMRSLGVEITTSIEAMLEKVDAVMLLSIDGRPHLEQARPVFATRKPLFVDKPVAASLADILRLFREAEASGTPCFSNSALRYSTAIADLRADPKIGRVLGCDAYSNNVSILPGHPDLFYYGIHGCEILFAIMGPGCKTVTRVKTPTADLAVGVWEDGRMGTFRGILQGTVGFGATVFGEKGIVQSGSFTGYEPLLAEIAKFFRTGKPPMSVEETLEIYSFLAGADESLRDGGRPISLQSVREQAQTQ
jgi:predicted dehydrogenase